MVEKKARKDMTTIWVEKRLVEELRTLGRMGDSFTAVIRRLIDGRKPEDKGGPHGDRHESTRTGNH